MARSVTWNSIHSFVFQLLGQGSSIATGIILARTLGPAGKGIVGYAAVALSMVTVFFDGQTEAIAYQVGRRKLPMGKVILATVRLSAVIIPVVAVALLGIAHAVPKQQILVATAIALPFALITQMCVPYLLVLDRVAEVNTQALYTNVAYLVFVAVAVLMVHASITVVLGMWILSLVVGMALAMIRLRSAYFMQLRARPAGSPPEQTVDEMLIADGRALAAEATDDAAGAALDATAAAQAQAHDPALLPPKSIAREQMTFTAKSGLAAVAGYLNLRIDVIIVSMLLGARELGVYTLAIATGELMWKVARAIIWAALGRIANSEPAEAARFVAKVTRHVFSFQFIAGIGIFLIGPLLIPLVYGSAFADAGPALRMLMPGFVAYTMEGAIGYYLSVQSGRPFLRVIVQGSSAIVCAIVSIATIPYFSIAGAALATSISYLCVITTMVVLFTRETKIPVRDLFVMSPAEIGRLRKMVLRKVGIGNSKEAMEAGSQA